MHGHFSKILGGGHGPPTTRIDAPDYKSSHNYLCSTFSCHFDKKISVQYLTLPCGLDVLPSNTEASTCSSPT